MTGSVVVDSFDQVGVMLLSLSDTWVRAIPSLRRTSFIDFCDGVS